MSRTWTISIGPLGQFIVAFFAMNTIGFAVLTVIVPPDPYSAIYPGVAVLIFSIVTSVWLVYWGGYTTIRQIF